MTATDHRAELEELRDDLRAAFKKADVAVKAQLAGQLRAVLKDLAAMPPSKDEVSKADELAARRKGRRPKAADSASPARRSLPRRGAGGNRTS